MVRNVYRWVPLHGLAATILVTQASSCIRAELALTHAFSRDSDLKLS
jgi:hypothetical protein